MNRFTFSVVVFFASSSVGAAPLSPEQSLGALERAAERFKESPTRIAVARTVIHEELPALRKPWITLSAYERISNAYRSDTKIPPEISGAEKAEAAFRLARHAFLLGRMDEANGWVDQIPPSPGTAPWRAKGQYLRGVLALKENRADSKPKAIEAFMLAAGLGGDSDAGTLATTALARMAFDNGQYEHARDLYLGVKKTPELYEASLDELAWAHLKLGRADLAATELDLLFTLYPQSRRLPDAGYLLGRLAADPSRHDSEGIQTLELLASRFVFELEASESAHRAYAGHEEELLAEFDPRLTQFKARAILPPIARTLIERNGATRSYLAQLDGLITERTELREDQGAQDAAAVALRQPGGTTIESLALWEWANHIEHQLLSSPENSSSLKLPLEDVTREVRELLQTVDESIAKLVEIDRHIWIQWKTLGGDREKEALAIKQKARESIARFIAQKMQLKKSQWALEALLLRARKSEVRKDALRLTALRTNAPASSALFARLDRVRSDVERKENERMPELSKDLPQQTRIEVETSAQIDRTIQILLAGAKKDLKSVLDENRRELARTITDYRWSVAETRFRSLRSAETALRSNQAEFERDLAKQEERYVELEETSAPSAHSASPPIRDSLPDDLRQRVEDSSHFLAAARQFIQDADRGISKRIANDKERYRSYVEAQENRLSDLKERDRERVILAYRDVMRSEPDPERAPYALYRLAQLHYERAEAVARSFERSHPNERAPREYTSAISPLERIRKEFPKFEHRDAALYLLGHVLLDSGEKRRSVGTFEQLVAEYPKSPLLPEVHLRIGENYFAEKAFTKAIPHYNAVLTYGFNFFYDKALYKLAWANYLLGRYDSAIAHFLILLDYASELSDDQKKRFVELEDEATEYVAFSLFRSGGSSTATRIFAKTGWKPYGLAILKQMAAIAEERSKEDEALRTYDLAIEHYPDSSYAPDVLSGRIRIFEKLNDNRSVTVEMERVLRLLESGGSWRNKNMEDRDALAAADSLVQRATYSLGTQYDASYSRSNDDGDRKKAVALYERLIDRYPQSEQAYLATYRLGEIAFAKGDYSSAIERYDAVVRNDRYSKHFSDSLYAMVVSREKNLTGRGGLDAVLAKEPGSVPPQAEALLQSIDNFTHRAPKDSRVPQTLYRSATVQAKIGRTQEASRTFLLLAERYPHSRWSQQAFVAAVDTFLAQEQWDDAAAVAAKTLQEKTNLPEEIRSELMKQRETSLFKAAESRGKKGQPSEAVEQYLAFQKELPTSSLAPAALFNAYAISMRSMNYDTAQQALTLLYDQYPSTDEGKRAPLQQALLYDAVFDIDRAIPAYRAVLARTLSPKDRENAILNLSQLFLARARQDHEFEELISLAKQLDEKQRAEIEFHAAELSEDAGQADRARSIRTSLALRPTAPSLPRLRAAVELAQAYWDTGNLKEAQSMERLADQFLRLLPKADANEGQVALASVRAAKISWKRASLRSNKIKSTSAKALVNTFQQKATDLANLEKNVLQLLELRSLRASASALFDLGHAYLEFVGELQELAPPPKSSPADIQELKETVNKLSAPLQEKAKDAFSKTLALLQSARLPETYLGELFKQTNGAAPTKSESAWADDRWPDPVPLLSESGTSPISLWKSVIVLASPPAATSNIVPPLWLQDERTKNREASSRILLERPNSAAALHNLFFVQLFEGDFSGAKRSLSLIGDRLGAQTSLRLKAAAAFAQGDYGEVVDILEPMLMKAGLDRGDVSLGESTRQLVLSRLLRGEKEKALSTAQTLIRLFPKSSAVHRALAAAFHASGDTRMARFALERTLRLDPGNNLASGELAILLDARRDLLTRSKLLETAAQSGHPILASNWAKLSYDVGKTEEACMEWKRANEMTGLRHPVFLKRLENCATSTGSVP
ncbi:MAG TPA: tetratricopeptide repeat protein [Bdellovibrionota bacterium]|nr:tetratricopeptide repeat protein [Bdellovibrionota bacterium]